jgi:hypothetical protein
MCLSLSHGRCINVVCISGAWVSCANVPGYRLTSPDTDSILWEKLVDAKCRPNQGTQIHIGSGDNWFSSRWRRDTLSAHTLGYDSWCVCQVGGISQIILAMFFPMDLVTCTPHVKKPPRKKSVGHDEWHRSILLEPDKKKRVRYCQRIQDFLRIPREYWTSHYLHKKSRSICRSLKDCGTAGRRGYFPQYGATCHVTGESMVMIQIFFDDRVIYTLRPPPSPELTPLDFWLWGYFQEGLFSKKLPRTTDVLK